MGFAITVTSVPAADRALFLQNAGLTDTGVSDEANETLLSGAQWRDQYLTWRNLRLSKRLASPSFDLMSNGLRLLSLELHETSMGAVVFCHENGSQVWSASGDENGYHTEGSVPLGEADLVALCSAQNVAVFGAEKAKEYAQADDEFTDPFAMVIELFVALTGFRYDAHDVDGFMQLEGDFPFPKPWWKIW